MKKFYAEPDAFRITGIKETNATQSADILNNNFFDLMSVKYVLSYNQLETLLNENNDIFINKILKENKPTQFLNRSIFSINKDSKNVFFEHAPGGIKVTLKKPAKAEYFYVYPAMSQDSFGIAKGDGVRFIAKINKQGTFIDEQEITLNAAHKKEDQKWFTMKLGPFPDGGNSYDFTLELITDKIGDNAYDWSGWGGFLWDTDLNKTMDKYKLIYDKEMKIYENKDYIPRLRFIDETLCVKQNSDKEKNYDNVVTLMKSKEKDIRNLAIVESNNCENKKYNPLAGKISNQKFEDQTVSFTYSSTEDQYGLLSDTYYSGWEIYVNGKKGIIDPVNLAFRGFKLPKGNNVKIRIIYEPWTVKIGLLVTLITLGFSIYLVFNNKKLR